MPPDSPGGGGGSGGGTQGGGHAGRPGHTASPGPLPPPASSFAPGSICERDGWCWYAPLPSGDDWRAVAGAGRTQLWVAGSDQHLLHFDGGRWRLVPAPLNVMTIWAASDNDVWFTGSDPATFATVIAHWDGVAVTQTATFGAGIDIRDIWGSGPDDVYAGSPSALLHWDGVSWTSVAGVAGGTVSGSGPNDVWVGNIDGMSHFDGTAWSRVPELEGIVVYDVSVVAPDEVWAITLRGDQVAEHFDGSRWTITFESLRADTSLNAIYAPSRGNVWLIGVRGASDNVPARGIVRHFDRGSWSSELITPTILNTATSTAGLGVIAVGGPGSIGHLVADPLPRFIDLRVGPTARLRSTFGTSPTDMWAVGDDGTIIHHDGRAVVAVPSGTTAHLLDVWGTAPDHVWVVGEAGTILRFDGNAFTTPQMSPPNIAWRAVFGVSRDDVWIAGDAGELAHWDGIRFTSVVLPGIPRSTIRDLHGLASNDIWLSGGSIVDQGTSVIVDGFVSHFDGTAWSPLEFLTFPPPLPNRNEPIVRIWEVAPNDVWALTDSFLDGHENALWHFDGATWTGIPSAGDPAAFMFPAGSGTGTFVFGPHDRWRTGGYGVWQRSTQ